MGNAFGPIILLAAVTGTVAGLSARRRRRQEAAHPNTRGTIVLVLLLLAGGVAFLVTAHSVALLVLSVLLSVYAIVLKGRADSSRH